MNPRSFSSLRSSRPFKIWTTGCLAIVVAALNAAPVKAKANFSSLTALGQRQFNGRGHEWKSELTVSETIHKIENLLQSQGLEIFAKFSPHSSNVKTLVLGSAEGVTPVLLEQPGEPVGLPLRVDIFEDDYGQTAIRFDDSWMLEQEVMLSDDMGAFLTLPHLLHQAFSDETPSINLN